MVDTPCLVPLLHISAGGGGMEIIKCPNPKCRRRILDDEGTETEWTVLEIKCRHCGKLVRLHGGPDGIEASIYESKKRRR